MDEQRDGRAQIGISRRAAVNGITIGAVSAVVARSLPVTAQRIPSNIGECVATAPPTEDGVGFVSLLVGGIIHDMPSGPVEIRLSRFTLEPGAPFPPASVPYPSLMYIETGASDCPGGAGRMVYGSDGAVLDTTTGDGIQHIPTGTTQYIPAGVPDGAGNDGAELMSSIIIEFVPVSGGGTPAATT
jgi:hypothetical protein